MDITTILGIIIALLGLVGGYLLDDGHLDALFVVSALLIVIGGTFGAVIVSFPKNRLKKLPKALRIAFQEPKYQAKETIEELVEMSTIARREGVLALEDRGHSLDNAFLKEGVNLIVDGTDPELTRQILEFEIDAVEQEYEGYAKIFESAGGYAPTMGIIGTVMGLIHVLGSLDNPEQLAPAIAVAFTATLYGVATANVLYLPMANKLKVRCEEEIMLMQLMLEGLLSLQAGENPQLIKKKLISLLHQDVRSELLEEEKRGEIHEKADQTI